MSEKYFVIENRNIGTIGGSDFVESVLFVGTKQECSKYEDYKRKEYKDRTLVDCYTISESEKNKREEDSKFYDSLTEAQKAEIIDVDGKKYVKAVYERNHT